MTPKEFAAYVAPLVRGMTKSQHDDMVYQVRHYAPEWPTDQASQLYAEKQNSMIKMIQRILEK
jgi:hypothetical protein